ncbi:MAG: DUF58 domain-containing protein [Deltaproteobacteria bacterium]|nr:MAG: DUF58 domain-containing protein [Deltaproteobacteria bacterium]
MLPRELLKKIRKIEIYTSRIVNNQLAGQYHSVFKGRGMAFEEVRPYHAGDDVRFIDWNVSARMNEPYVKLFVEERDRTVMLLVDMSASGWFGSREQTKREIAAELSALIAFSAIKNNDRVGLIIFTDDVERFVPPKKGAKHVLRVITEILTFEPASRRTDLVGALEFLGKVAKRRSVAFVVSDFAASGWEHAIRVASRRHDVIPAVVTDPLEEALPDVGLIALEDLETGDLVEFDSSGPAARAYAARVAAERARREDVFRRLKMDFVNVRTDQAYVSALIAFFRARARRMHLA